jgi:hypothetical protein
VGAVLGRAVVAQGSPAKVDEVVAYVRDRVQPLVDSLPGSHGLSMFVNRETGMIVVNSVWADEASLAGSDGQLEASRAEAMELLEAPEVQIHLIEPAVIYQNEPDRPGFWARAAEIQHAPERMESAILGFRDVALPAMRERFAGINTVALLVNRNTGYCVVNVTYTSREAMEASREEAERMRAENLRGSGAEILAVHELEVAIVGIRPPVDLPAQGGAVEFPSSIRR